MADEPTTDESNIDFRNIPAVPLQSVDGTEQKIVSSQSKSSFLNRPATKTTWIIGFVIIAAFGVGLWFYLQPKVPKGPSTFPPLPEPTNTYHIKK